MAVPSRRILIALLAILIFGQGSFGAAHGHALEGDEITHSCAVCQAHTSAALAPVEPKLIERPLRAEPLFQAVPRSKGAPAFARGGPRAPPVSISL